MAFRKRRAGDVMAATKNMSDAELREELQELGVSPGPITDSTRGVYQKKLQKLKVDAAKGKRQESGRARRSEGSTSTRTRRSEPLEDNEGDWEDEEDRAPVLARKSFGGRSGRAEDRFYSSNKSVPAHVEDAGLWRSDRSSLSGGPLASSTADYGDYTGYEHRSSLGGDRLPRTNFDYSGSLEQKSRSSLGGDRSTRITPDYGGYLGQEVRSSLGADRSARITPDYGGYLGQEVRSSLGGERFTSNTSDYSGYLGQEVRSSLGGSDRFPKTTSNYGSMEREVISPMGVDRFSTTTNRYGSLEQEAGYSLGGERFKRSTPDYGGYLGQEVRFRSPGERSGLPISRDEGRPWPRYNEGATKGQLSYKDYPNLSQGKSAQSKPNWSRTLEYYLSKLVRALSVGLVIVFFGILIMKSGILYSTQQDDIELIPPDCEGKADKYCQTMQKQIILEILSELYNFLSLEAGSFECGNPSDLKSKCIPVRRAKEHVMNVFDHAPEKFDSALDWLLSRDEHLGIWAKDEDGEIVATGSLVSCVESSRPYYGITCRLINALYTAISNLFLALFVVFVLWLFLIYLRYHWRKVEEEQKQMFAMVEKIIDVVKHHYKDYQHGIERIPFIGILHVRDTLIMPQDRKRLKSVWDRAVQFIEDNESRLRTESQRVAGADLLVWRWTQTRHDISSERFSPTLLSTLGR
ncbi:LEM domain-containing protein 2 [Rana temporaria]|uniref:LEM domain-containing protein 2 n=1 Tax=Rana temporaria TaxID=8407 RepID=UPI001AAC5119|nr:LEM domain-containing protein 2 [Rana temporaria]